MLVRAMMEDKPQNLVTATAETTVENAMEMLINKRISCLPILDSDQKLVGVVSDQDIFKKIHEHSGDYRVLRLGDFMTTELIVGVPEDSLEYVAKIMTKNWIRHLPIVDGDDLVGLVSQRDIVREQSQNMEAENRYLKLYTNSMGSRDKSSDH